jgi:hypothetical protein
MMTRQTNQQADRARAVLREYARRIGDPQASIGTLVADVLADLLHLCRREGVEFERCLLLARAHVLDEERGAL